MIMIGNHLHGRMIARAAGVSYDDQADMCISRAGPDGQLMGGAIYCNYNGATVMMHMAGLGNWSCGTLLWLGFDYPFVQLGVKKLLCTASSGNPKAIDLIRRAGFSSEHRLIDGCANGDLLLFSMLPQNCRWLKLAKRYRKSNGNRGEGVHVHATA